MGTSKHTSGENGGKEMISQKTKTAKQSTWQKNCKKSKAVK